MRAIRTGKTKDEMWADIPGFNGKYQASPFGEVRRVFPSGRTRMLTPYHRPMNGSQRLIVKLTADGKSREKVLMQVIAETFIGECPDGFVAHHVNGLQCDNHIANIRYISKSELGRKTGALSKGRSVVKLDGDGNPVEYYRSARQAGRMNHMSYQTVIDRCNGKVKNPRALDGYDYAWEDGKGRPRKGA